MNHRWLRTLVCSAILGGLAAPPAPFAQPQVPAASAQQRRDFLAASEAYRRRDMARYREIAGDLTDYPLYPYLRYRRLTDNLATASPTELTRFLTEYADTPLADRLRGNWIAQLANSGHWKRLASVYVDNGSVERSCRYHLAQLKNGQRRAALAAARQLWLSGRSQPRACDPLFKALADAGKIAPALAWQRVELAMRAGQWRLARYLMRYLDKPRQNEVRRWINLYRDPGRLARERPRGAHANLIAAHILGRLAWRDAALALTLYRTHYAGKLDDALRGPLLSTLAIALAQQDCAPTQDFLANVDVAQLSDAAREWRLRWALRQQRWKTLLAWHEDLGATQKASNRWRYWHGRALLALGEERAARADLLAVAEQRDFYGFLAADWMHRPYQFSEQPTQVQSGVLGELANSPFMRRAAELRHFARDTEANREWRFGLRNADEPLLQAALQLASAAGWHRHAIHTAARARAWDDLQARFPVAYREPIDQAASQARLEPSLVYGVVRRESAFDVFARSGAGARGLMQLMPATARRVARQTNRRWHGSQRLYDERENLTLGSWYLASLLTRFDGHVPVALAAYNAGPNRAERWLAFAGTLPADVWIETITYQETRDYVAAVLAYNQIYRRQLGLTPKPLRQYLPTLTGRLPADQTARQWRRCSG